MITLHFEGPKNIIEFRDNKLADFLGVYIWGFKGLMPDKEVFVPYYVGITAEKTTIKDTILKRHIKGINNPKSTYQRLTNRYMKEFFKNAPVGFPVYPIYKSSKKIYKLNWQGWDYPIDYCNCFEYYNNKFFISNKIKFPNPQPSNSKNDFFINLIPNLLGTSSDYLVTQLNSGNFWICFASVNKKSTEFEDFKKLVPYKLNNKKSYDETVFEIFETYVKYSLRGITIGKHEGDLANLQSIYFNSIKINGCNNIFKKNPCDQFPGDYI